MMTLLGVGFAFLFAIISNHCLATPLDDYVNARDSVFSWKLLQTYTQPNYTLFILNMTSQRWLNDSFSSHSIWWHYISITIPRNVLRSKTAFLWVGHGDVTDPVPTTDLMADLAVNLNTTTATVWRVPNQPFVFRNDPLHQSRREDELIAWTWKTFFDTNGSDPRMLLYFPMTKAVVRAMDAIQQFLQQRNLIVPQKFVVGGSSKRGWTIWLTAAVNNGRVMAATPIVMDLINMRANMLSHYRSLGGWTFAFYDYYERNLTRYMNRTVFDKLAQNIDPYSYFSRYREMKIFQAQGAGDEFFLLDGEDFFWNDLQAATGGSYLRRIPNTGHDIQGYQASLYSFYVSVVDKVPLPSMKWTRTVNRTHGTIRAICNFCVGKSKPTSVVAYLARTTDTSRRDFRQAKLDLTNGNVVSTHVVWTRTSVKYEVAQRGLAAAYSLTIPIPSDGHWVAAFIEATYSGPIGTTLILTTETLILPQTYPVPKCVDQGCYGSLV